MQRIVTKSVALFLCSSVAVSAFAQSQEAGSNRPEVRAVRLAENEHITIDALETGIKKVGSLTLFLL